MEIIKILVLAVLQGIAEFLPISSSSHILIVGNFLRIDAEGAELGLFLHAGTLLSICFYYRRRLARLISGIVRGDKEEWRFALSLVLGCVPAALFYIIANDFISSKFDGDWRFTGSMLIVTGIALISLRVFRHAADNAKIGFGRALLIGIAQALAIIPGISRSGATIVCARHLRVNGKDAADFSFLMSLPLVAGALILQLLDMGEVGGVASFNIWAMLLAVFVSFAVGCLAIKILIRVLTGARFWLFGIYCIIAGMLLLLFFP